MTLISATEFARNLSLMLDRVHYTSEEMVILRNRQAIARVVPGAPLLRADEAFADLLGTLTHHPDGNLRPAAALDRPLSGELEDAWA